MAKMVTEIVYDYDTCTEERHATWDDGSFSHLSTSEQPGKVVGKVFDAETCETTEFSWDESNSIEEYRDETFRMMDAINKINNRFIKEEF